MPRTEIIDTGDVELSCRVLEGSSSATSTGRMIICAHGFPDCALSFRFQEGDLVANGYTVVTPSMRAYAPSTIAQSGRYDAAALGADLIAIADALSPDEPVDILGHDWGAVAGYAAASIAPSRVRKLITAAVPHLRTAMPKWVRPLQLRKSWYMGLFQFPWFAERRVLQRDMELIDRLWRDWSPGFSCPPDHMMAVKRAIEPNVTDVLGYYRALRKPRRESSKAVFSRVTVPAMYVHGIDDGCIDVSLTKGMATAYEAGLEVHHLQDAGHFAHLEQPARFNALMLRFLADG